LTSHGVLQAQRLGAHLASRRPRIGRIAKVFASDLQRASKTADAIIDAQRSCGGGQEPDPSKVLVPDMRERDFRSWEGKRFGKGSGLGSDEPRHPDAETREEMHLRVRRFVSEHLVPALETLPAEPQWGPESATVVVVAHGLILNVLLRKLLADFGRDASEKLSADTNSDYFAAWSNTGYLEAEVIQISPSATGNSADGLSSLAEQSFPIRPGRSVFFRFIISTVNCVDHLQGFKKTRGGIGSAQFDSKQKTMDSFFKASPKKRNADAANLPG
jgi:probable phosphoglycerate mutase